MEEIKDNPVEETIEGDPSQKSEETAKEPLTNERLTQIVQGLQKGFYGTREELAEIKNNLQVIADQSNKQTGATSGEDEYLTVGKLRQILSEQTQQVQERQTQAETYVEKTLADLRNEGVIASKQQEDDLVNYALKIKEPDLRKAATIWQDIQEAKQEMAKTKKAEVQKEGSKVGTSSKTPAEETGGLDYDKVKRMSWY
jgi:hypothetical protein